MVEIIPSKGRPLRAGRYIDPRGETFEDVLVDPADGRLITPPTPGADVLDLGPFTIVPGMVDAHVHLALPPPRLGEDPAAVMAGRLDRFAEHGLVAVRDGGDRLGHTLALKKRGGLPYLAACGPALHPPGSYGSFLGPGSDPDEIAGCIDVLARSGADHVKLLVTGPVNLESPDMADRPHFTAGALALLTGAAHRRGLKVMAHVNGVVGVRLALEAGVDSIEHGYGMDDATLALLAERGTTWIPTLVPMAALGETGPPRLRRAADAVLARQMDAVRRGHELGVTLAVGTDAGAPGVRHGASYRRELLLLAAAGVPAGALVRAAAAESLLGPYGAPGRPWVFAAVEGNPLADAGSLGRVRAVIV